MKQAILITAYKNVHHLLRLIHSFDENYSFYIHIDRKSSINPDELQALQQTGKNVFVSRAYTTNWGGTAHLQCTLLLLKEALRDKHTEYIHLISGHDFPIKTSAYFSLFLEKNKGAEFMEHFALPTEKWAHGGTDRLAYYNLYDWIDAKGSRGHLIQFFKRIQQKLRYTRNMHFGGLQLYGGSTWWTLSRQCCEYVMDFTEKEPAVLRRFRHTFCAEEIYFQTVVMNSPFKDAVRNDNLRLIIWENRHGNIPAILDESDYDNLVNSPQLFARRFEYPVSEKLLAKLSGH